MSGRQGMHDEYELKLALSPEHAERLRRNPLIRSLASSRGRTRALHSIYFDTPAQSLRRRGMALRVRRVGGRWIQTLKIPGGGTSGLQHYKEFESPVAAGQPELGVIDDPALRQVFEKEGLAEQLRAIFTTEFARSSFPLKVEDTEVELAIDRGEIVSGDSRMPICEAELELVSGSPRRIYELALALHERVPFRLETRTKAARGYGLTEKTEARPVKAKPLKLDRGMTVAEAFAAAARNCIEQIRANEAAVLAGVDPEGVHQLRVGVRRLRALVSAFKPVMAPEAQEILRRELGWLQRQLGPAREWDVFRDETLSPLRQRLPAASGLGELAAEAAAMRERAYQQAAAALGDSRYAALLLRLQLWLDGGGWGQRGGAAKDTPLNAPVSRFTCKVLGKRFKKLRGAAGKRHDLSEAELHEVRIAAKKLRYAAEFFQSLYGKKAVGRQIKALEGLQDTLGSLNDAVTGDSLLAQLTERLDPGDGRVGPDATLAIAAVRGWQAACVDRDLGHFEEAWAGFEKTPVFWR